VEAKDQLTVPDFCFDYLDIHLDCGRQTFDKGSVLGRLQSLLQDGQDRG
jgi:hypothetical protein